MTIEFTPEDATGLANATSYADVAGANQYAENTGRLAAWDALKGDQKKALLNSATQYMDEIYGDRYCGEIQAATIDTQALLWPRENVPNDRGDVYPASPLPDALLRATYEFAFAFMDGGLNPYGVDEGSTQTVTEKTVRVEGAVMKSEKFGSGGKAPRKRRYPKAEAALRSLIVPAFHGVIRA